MFRRFALRIIMGVFCLLILASCGDGDSQTNGQLTVSASSSQVTGGLYVVDALATYSNAGAGSLQGFPITLTFTATTINGAVLQTIVKNLDADVTGKVSSSLLVPQTNVATIVTVVASSGGLSDREVVVVPSIAAMTSSPAVVAFPLDALAGSTQTVAISGGSAPYTATIDPAHVSDLSVSVNGNSIVLTKLKNSVANGPAILAILTVSDSSSATPIAINVSYN